MSGRDRCGDFIYIIPHSCGIKALYPTLGAHNEYVAELLEFLLNNNYFQLLGVNYHQLRGTCMGAPWAPAYMCLHLWLRYIDVLMVWRGTIEQLADFMQELNQNERNIGYTYSHHEVTLPFLNLQIAIEGTKIIKKCFEKKWRLICCYKPKAIIPDP